MTMRDSLNPAGPGSILGVRRANSIASWALVPIALFIAVLIGLLSAVGAVLYAGVLTASIIGVALLANPRVHIAAAMLFALVVTGVLEFFFSFGQANWLATVLVGAGILAAVVRGLVPEAREQVSPAGGFALLVMLYILCLAASTIFNQISIAQAIVGTRNYIPYLGVSMLMIYCGITRQFARKLTFGLLAIGLAQLPFALYQQFVTAPWRASLRNAVGRPDEAIVGSFGGSAVTGGYTGEMAAFLVMCMVFVAALRRERIISLPVTGVMMIVLVTPILLAETKVAIVLLPVLMLTSFFTDAKKNRRFFVGILIAMSLLLSGIAAVYFYRYWGDSSSAARTLGYSFDPDFMVNADHRGRVGTLIHWFENNVRAGDAFSTLIGHGIASTLENSSTIGAGSAVRRFGLGLDSHAMSRLLWDIGVLGFAVFAALGARAVLLARRMSGQDDLQPPDRAGLVFAGAAMLGMLMMLPYQKSVLGGSAVQFLFWYVVGYIELMWRTSASNRRASNRPPRSSLKTGRHGHELTRSYASSDGKAR